jgi:hypothetical protein
VFDVAINLNSDSELLIICSPSITTFKHSISITETRQKQPTTYDVFQLSSVNILRVVVWSSPVWTVWVSELRKVLLSEAHRIWFFHIAVKMCSVHLAIVFIPEEHGKSSLISKRVYESDRDMNAHYAILFWLDREMHIKCR